MIIRKYEEKDLTQMIDIWNEVVEDGIAFPQEDLLNEHSGKEFFESQSYTGVRNLIRSCFSRKAA